MRRLAVLLLAAVLVAPCPAHASDDEGEDVSEPLPWRIDADTVFLRRIVEAATGKPVAGALVRLYAEESVPTPGFGTPMASAKSDVDGWVRVRKADLDVALVDQRGEPNWAYAEAPGLGPNGVYGVHPQDDDFPLDRSTTTHVSIRDPIGRPVADAHIGWFIGCGHMPDLRTARTGSDGIAHLTGVSNDDQAQMWGDRTGFASGYVNQGWRAWQRPVTTDVNWGDVFEGTILTNEGAPAPGVAIGAPFAHRGPWVRTDSRGNFRLVGSQREAGDSLDVIFESEADHTPTGVRSTLSFPAPPPGHRALVRLPAPGAPIESEVTTRLVVEPTIDWPSSQIGPEIRIIAVRLDDGWTTSGATGPQQVALLDVRPGKYVVYAEVRRQGCGLICSRGRAAVTAPAGVGAWVPMTLPSPAFLPIVLGSPPGEGFQLELLTDGEVAGVHLEEGATRFEVWVAADRRVFVRASRGDRSHVVAVDPKGLAPYERAPDVVVPMFPPLEIRAHFLDDGGNPVDGWLRSLATTSDGNDESDLRSTTASTAPSLTVISEDRVALVAWPRDEGRLQPSIIDVPSSAFGGKPIDLGNVRLKARTPTLRLKGPNGTSDESERFLITRGERTEEVWTRGTPVLDPWLEPGLLGEDAIVRSFPQSGTNDVPYVRTLDGTGPWTIRAPSGSLTIEARGDEDELLEGWSVHLDGRAYQPDGKSLRLSTLDAGRHEVVAQAQGRTPRRLRFTLAADERRTWSVRLRASPSGPR